MNRSKDMKISYKAMRTSFFIALAIFGAFLSDTTSLETMPEVCMIYGMIGSVVSTIKK